jgi:hypothetical protein
VAAVRSSGLLGRPAVGVLPVLLLIAGCGGRDFIVVSDTPAGAYETSLAVFDDGYTAAWYDTRDGHAEIYIRAREREGRPAGPSRRLTTTSGNAYEPDVQPLGSDLVIGWYDKRRDGHLTPWLGAWSREGAARWAIALAERGRNTVVRVDRGAVFAAWVQDEDENRSGVWGGWWRTDGSVLVRARRLADASRTTWNLNAAVDPSAPLDRRHAWVTFDAAAGTRANELFVVDVPGGADSHGHPGPQSPIAVRLTTDDGFASTYPDLVVSADGVTLTWFDARDGNEEVYLASGPRALLANPQALHPVRVTSTPGHSIGAYLARNGNRIGLAWCDDSDGGQHEIFFRPFTTAGAPMGDAVRLTHTQASSSIPAIRASGTGFALLWNEYEQPPGGGHDEEGRSDAVFRRVP